VISGTPPPGGGGHLIERNHIGTDRDGGADLGNGGAGIFIDDTPNNTIQDNVIAGNGGDGILIVGRDPNETGAPTSGAQEQTVVRNIFGTDPANQRDLANGGTAAITITSDSPEPPPGTPSGETRTDSIAKNSISGRANGIHITGPIPRLVKCDR
jgi:parallel beta-helix repeat protein